MAPRRPVQLSLSVRPVLNCRALFNILNLLLLPSAPTGQRERDVDSAACLSIALSAGIIFTTIHTQDYRDAPGDAAGGRVTLPIAYPVLSRAVTAFLLVAWSWGVCWTWRLDDIAAGFLCVLALIVGVSFVARTDVRADVISAYLYNVSSITRDFSRALLTQPSMPDLALCDICTPCISQAAFGIVIRYL
jgi:hypothetical protein